MSCSLDTIKTDSLDKVKSILKGKATSVELKDTYAVFKYGEEFKVKHMDSAVKHAQRKQEEVEKWAEEKFGKAFANGWTSLKTTPESVIIDFSFPHRLSEAYQRKLDVEEVQEEQRMIDEYKREKTSPETIEDTIQDAMHSRDYVYNGEVYPSYEDMMLAIDMDTIEDDFLPANRTYAPVNHLDYVANKKNLIEKLDRKIASLTQMRNTHPGEDSIVEELHKAQENRARVHEQIAILTSNHDVYERVMDAFESDFEFIDELLAGDVSLQTIDIIDDMLNYFKHVSQYERTNEDNILIGGAKVEDIHPELREKLDQVASKLNKYKEAIRDVKEKIVLEMIEDSPKIRSLYGDGTMDPKDILKEMLAEKFDIDIASQMTLGVEKSYWHDDGLFTQMFIEDLKAHINDEKSTVIGLKGRLDNSYHDVVTALRKHGYGTTIAPLNKFMSTVSFDIFFQRGKYGRTGKIIDVFSEKWDSAISNFKQNVYKRYTDATARKDYSALNEVLKDKYDWLSTYTEFLDISRVPEIITDPSSDIWADKFGSLEEAETYREEVISKIGKHNYDKMVHTQLQKLEDFRKAMDNRLQAVLEEHNVSSFEELPDKAKVSLTLHELNHDPFAFIDSHYQQDPTQRGLINYDIGDNNSQQVRAHMLYNTYFPKEKVTGVNKTTGDLVDTDSGFYDADYKVIDQDPALKQFWEILQESTEFLHQSLAQSGMMLSKGALIAHKRGLTEILLARENRWEKGKKVGKFIYEGVRDFMHGIYSAKDTSSIKAASDVNKGDITMVQEKVNQLSALPLLRLKNILGKEIKANTVIKLSSASRDVQEIFLDLDPSASTIEEVINKIGDRIQVKKAVRGYVTEQVMSEQTMNLPLLLKGYLDVVAEYSARKKAMPLASILKDLHTSIRKKDENESNDPQDKARANSDRERHAASGSKTRERSNKRFEDSFQKNILNVSPRAMTGRFGKTYTGHEADIVKEIDKRLKEIKKQRNKPNISGVEMDNLDAEKDTLLDMKKKLGQTVAVSVFYDNFVNKLSRFAGLAFNIHAAFKNVTEGYRNSIIHDNGKYGKPGSMMIANAFYFKSNGKKIASSKHRNEIKKGNLLIANMDLLQDGTNEFEKNSKKTGVGSKLNWFKPFKPTEVTEGMIQKPQIWGMLMSEYISYTDSDGVTHRTPIFDGTGFPAHKLEGDVLVLKDEYRYNADGTENLDNIDKWEKFKGKEYNSVQGKIKNVVTELNGDYSQTGTMMMKNNPLSATFTVFKTWVPAHIWTRIAKDQRVLATGKKNYNGFYTGVLRNQKTKAVGTMNALTNIATTATVSGSLGIALLGGLGIAGGVAVAVPATGLAIWKYKQLREKAESAEDNIKLASQLAAYMKGTLSKMLGVPLNMGSAALGLNKVYEGYDYKDLEVTEEDRQNLHAMSTELAINLYTALLKIATVYAGSLLFTDDEEEEPMYIDDPARPGKRKANPNWIKQKEDNPNHVMLYHAINNYLTGFLADGTMFYSPNSTVELLGKRNVLFSRLEEIQGLQSALNTYSTGRDVISKGRNAGESRTMNSIMAIMGAPKPVKDFGTWYGMMGFEASATFDFTPNQGVENWFLKDYKVDRGNVRRARSLERARLQEQWKEEYNYDSYDKLTKKRLDKLMKKDIERELDTRLPMPVREDYKDDQNSY